MARTFHCSIESVRQYKRASDDMMKEVSTVFEPKRFRKRIADCCSSNINIDNAFVSCLTNNVSCNAECYRGYIFPSGSTKENYSCQNGTWPPMLSSCKRMLLKFFMV
uniref:Sushi domain-containing protein n=1 Tax=Magallana gigas TaxID=29159 RepID=K1RFH3_MAGGI